VTINLSAARDPGEKDLSYGPRYHRVYAVFPPVRAGRLLPGDSRALRRHLPSIVSCIPPVATWMIAVADKPAQEKVLCRFLNRPYKAWLPGQVFTSEKICACSFASGQVWCSDGGDGVW